MNYHLNYKNIFFTILCLLISQLTILGQSSETSSQQDTLILKDGSVVIGEVLSKIEEKIILIQIEGTDVVSRIKRQKIVQAVINGTIQTNRDLNYNYTFKPRRSSFEVAFGVIDSDIGTGSGLDFGYFYGLSKYANIGLNISSDAYEDDMIYLRFKLTTINASFRSYFLEGQFNPFVGFNVGHSFTASVNNYNFFPNPTQDVEKGGIHFNPYLGLKIGVKTGLNLVFSVGYKIQKAEFRGSHDVDYVDFRPTFQRLQYRLGLNLRFGH